MPRDGTGTYNLPTAAVVNGTVISASDENTTRSDLATALTQSLARDGQTVPTANLPMGTYRHTNVGNGSARNDYAALGQVQDGAILWAGTAAGTANARTAFLTPAISAYAAGMMVGFINGSAASTATDPTLALNGLTARAIKRPDGTALPPGALPANALIRVQDDGTNWRLTNMPDLRATVSRAAVQSITSGSTTNVSFDTEDFDPIQAWVVGTPERLTVPAGVTRVAVRLSVRWGNSAAGSRFAQIRLNGTTLVASDIRIGSDGSGSHQSCLGELTVTAGDYFEARVTQDSGGALNVAYAQMVMQVVG